jgi:hypothetical protein
MTSLTALRTALMDTAEGIRTLASKYSTIEEINQNAGNELSQLIQQAQSDLASLQSATGDSSAAPAAQPAGASQPAGTSQPAGGAQSSGATG